MMTGNNTRYELASKAGGTAYGGMAAIHAFAKKIGLPKRIDDSLCTCSRNTFRITNRITF